MNIGRVGRLAFFNVIRLGSGFLFVGLLPVLVRRLSAPEYDVWVLVTQVPAYVALLGSGVSVAVVRLVAAASDDESESVGGDAALSVVAGSRVIVQLALIGLVGTVLLAVFFDRVFTSVPQDLVGTARLGVLFVGAGGCFALFSIPVIAYFNGIQSAAASTWLVVGSRAAAVLGVLVVLSSGLEPMFGMVGASLVGGAVAQQALFRKRVSAEPSHMFRSSRATEPGRRLKRFQRDIRSTLATFAVWSAVSIVSNGLDIAIVGAFDFEQVGTYGAIASIVLVFGGLHSSLMSAFLPSAAQSRSTESLSSAILIASRAGGALSFLFVGGCVAFGFEVLRIAFGREIADDGFPILMVLVCGRAMGNLIWPYVVGVLAVGAQSRIVATPIIEGAVNLVCSVLLVRRFGAIGAAVGTLIAATTAVAMHLVFNVGRTPAVPFDRSQWFRQGVVESSQLAVPLLVLAVVRTPLSGVADLAVTVGLLLVTALLGLRFLHRLRLQ